VTGARVLPIDSEHSALHQCLAAANPRDVARIVLTASGGPFLRHSREDLARVTAEDSLRHPTWNMGPRVTVDSATLLNKGFEIIEAHWLFDVPTDSISVLVHPQSLVHAIVEFADGSCLAQMAAPDMRLPIQYALTYPERLPSLAPPLDLAASGPLSFEPPDLERFPCLGLAFEAARAGGTAPACLNAADEVAVGAFLDGRIAFGDIALILSRVLAEEADSGAASLESIIAADERSRLRAGALVRGGVR
jgi:1-deoxy-D-xylulose-5-phosphate reductoisomerase